MEAPQVIVIDFESFPIEQRPAYPPKPVGVSVIWPDMLPEYLAWGHPTGGNNCKIEYAADMLRQVWDSGLPVLFHHAAFDLSICYEIFGLPELPWQRVHDTMFLAFLLDPHARKHGLKPLAADWLQMPQDERDAVEEWLWEHRVQLKATYGITLAKSKLGKYIAYAPGDVVGPYANGDVVRTLGLFQKMWPLVQRYGMAEAYDREREVLPIFMENEREGIRVDRARLERDIPVYRQWFNGAEDWLRGVLKADGLNFDANQDVIAVLIARGIVREEDLSLTGSGQLATNKDALPPHLFTDPNVAAVLGYRNRLSTCLRMFMEPWQLQASKGTGRIHTSWNQVRNPEGGTRTGRPSTSDPNLLNISKDFNGRDDGFVKPNGWLDLPLCRQYLLPDEGHTWLHRDFSGQELRVFAHFECGELFDAYMADPATDPHKLVGAKMLELTGREIERTKVKTLNFQGMYGGGIPAAAAKLRVSMGEAREFKTFHDRALPGRRILNDAIKAEVNRGNPIRTWGGRLYYCEEPGMNKKHKKFMTYEYKLINYIIQGSAADLTKQAMIDWRRAGAKARFLAQVYDEINVSAAFDEADAEMALLREVMERPRLDVPMLSDGKRGPTWGNLEKCA